MKFDSLAFFCYVVYKVLVDAFSDSDPIEEGTVKEIVYCPID